MGNLIHNVFFTLKNPNSREDRDALLEGLKILKGIPQVKKAHIGVLASTEQRDVVDVDFQVSETLFFDSEEDQQIYQDHPIHHEFIAKCSSLWAKVRVFDTIDV
ncbi:MAG: hypothetical protein RIR51_732 [Bacteroidota bacterium]|jgi:hypothetical protein